MPKTRLEFPANFVWGASTAGHQVEGDNIHSDWWKFEQEGKVYDGTVSGKAVDYWNRYEEDHNIISEIGMQGFRLGIEWARVEPRKGQIDREALAHYKAMLESLRSKGIKICLTIYHWVLPLWFADMGGWTHPKAVEHFMKFVRLIANELGEYPMYWVTLNEPSVPPTAGYLAGVFPPEKKSFRQYCLVVKRLLEAHAESYETLHQIVPRNPEGGKTQVCTAHAYQYVDAWGSPGPAQAYEEAMKHFVAYGSFNAWDMAIKSGRVPFPFGLGERIEGLEDSYDICGVNYYTRMSLKFNPTKLNDGFLEFYSIPDGIEENEMGWQIYPPGFLKTLRMVWKRFHKPIIITENGVADDADRMRSKFTLEHVAQLYFAIQEGIDIRAYFHWSYIDNFEWREGYVKKLGLIACDYADPELKRVWRKSAYMYKDLIAENAITEDLVNKYAPDAYDGVFGNKWRI